MLKAADDYTAFRKLGTLIGIEGLNDPPLKTVVELLKHAGSSVRFRAVEVLREIKPQDSATLHTIVKVLEHSDTAEVRASAADALGAIKPLDLDHSISLALARALRDPDSFVRSAAANALGTIKSLDSDHSISLALARALRDPDSFVRSRAANALGAIKPLDSDHSISLALAQALSDDDDHVRFVAAWALKTINPEAKDAFKKALDGWDPSIYPLEGEEMTEFLNALGLHAPVSASHNVSGTPCASSPAPATPAPGVLDSLAKDVVNAATHLVPGAAADH